MRRPSKLGVFFSVVLPMIGIAMVSIRCSSFDCFGGCAEGESCTEGTCRENGMQPVRTFCEQLPEPADHGNCARPHPATTAGPASGGELACPSSSAATICCTAAEPYFCPATGKCVSSVESAQLTCTTTCGVCANLHFDAGGSECPIGSGKCTDIGACCPCEKPFYGCGLCFATQEGSDAHCYERRNYLAADAGSLRRGPCACK